MDAVYGDSSPLFTTVKFCAAELKHEHTSLDEDECLRLPKTVTSDENIVKIPQMLLNNHRIKVREIAEAMNISKEG